MKVSWALGLSSVQQTSATWRLAPQRILLRPWIRGVGRTLRAVSSLLHVASSGCRDGRVGNPPKDFVARSDPREDPQQEHLPMASAFLTAGAGRGEVKT